MSPAQDLRTLIQEYFGKTRTLQIATASDQQPWCCTLYYAIDENWDLYWLSLPTARHSGDISRNPRVSGAIAFSQEPPTGHGVQGLQFEGLAEELSGDNEEQASGVYVAQLNREASLLNDIRSGKNPHKFYRIRPTKFVLFDSTHFPDNPRQELVLEPTQ